MNFFLFVFIGTYKERTFLCFKLNLSESPRAFSTPEKYISETVYKQYT